jgi:transcriptional regulator with XRE-family HTH domain
MKLMKFSEFMRVARGDMSLYELARRTGITAQQLANYERGRSKATVDKAAAICRALNVTFTIGA